jgi:ABC-type sugar transport system substrate-binding protein
VKAIQSGLIDATWDANQNGQGELMMVNALKALASGKAEPSTLAQFTEITKANAADYIPWSERAK